MSRINSSLNPFNKKKTKDLMKEMMISFKANRMINKNDITIELFKGIINSLKYRTPAHFSDILPAKYQTTT